MDRDDGLGVFVKAHRLRHQNLEECIHVRERDMDVQVGHV
jgi:hypothetical protein